MTPAVEARQLASVIFGLQVTEFAGADFDLNDIRLLVDLLGRQIELDARFLSALHSGEPMNEDDLHAETNDILAAAQAVETLRFELKGRKRPMKTDFLNKMLTSSPENKTAMLMTKVSSLRKRQESTEARLRDARQRSADAVRALRESEDRAILGEISQGDLDRARKGAADAILAIEPVELDLANDRGLLQRAGELLAAQINQDQQAAARERLAEHSLFRRDLSAALPGILALIERGIGIEARMKGECPKAMNDFAKTIRPAVQPSTCVAPELALHPLVQWLEALRVIHPEDLADAAAELLDAKAADLEAQAQVRFERGQKQRQAQEQNRVGSFNGRISAMF